MSFRIRASSSWAFSLMESACARLTCFIRARTWAGTLRPAAIVSDVSVTARVSARTMGARLSSVDGSSVAVAFRLISDARPACSIPSISTIERGHP